CFRKPTRGLLDLPIRMNQLRTDHPEISQLVSKMKQFVDALFANSHIRIAEQNIISLRLLHRHVLRRSKSHIPSERNDSNPGPEFLMQMLFQIRIGTSIVYY